MTGVSITSPRRSGKTTALAASVIIHALDQTIEAKNFHITASSIEGVNNFSSAITKQLNNMGIPYIREPKRIVLGDKTIRILYASPKALLAAGKVDYLFIDNADFVKPDFMDEVDLIVRPYAIVIETRNQIEEEFEPIDIGI